MMTAKTRPLNKQIRERLAACEAVGLHYWGDHPAKCHFWAVDDYQRAHVVRIDRTTGTARHACRPAPLNEDDEQCTGAAEAVAYTVELELEKEADRDDLTA
jgi:hypothetical protein